MEVSRADLLFKHPFTCIVSGSTGSGKTTWIRKFLEQYDKLMNINPENTFRVLWCYGQWQPLYSDPIKHGAVTVKYTEGLPSKETIASIRPHLIVIDDLMTELSDSVELSNLFTKRAHHLNISVMFVVQNMFHKGRVMRDIAINSHYYVLLSNRRDLLQISTLGRQLFPGNSSYFLESYKDAIAKPFGYLIVDMKPDTPEHLRVRTNIFAAETLTVYVPKKKV